MLNRTAIIGFAAAGGIVLAALGYAAGYASGRASQGVQSGSPQPFGGSQPSTSAPSGCWWGDFPYYPGSQAVAAANPKGYAHHTYTPAPVVANYFANGASQMAWSFTLVSHSSSVWIFRMTRPPSCSGVLYVRADPAGGTLFEADPATP